MLFMNPASLGSQLYIKTSEFVTYLVDVFCVTGTIKKNIENRRNCAVGSVSHIVSMLDQMSL